MSKLPEDWTFESPIEALYELRRLLSHDKESGYFKISSTRRLQVSIIGPWGAMITFFDDEKQHLVDELDLAINCREMIKMSEAKS